MGAALYTKGNTVTSQIVRIPETIDDAGDRLIALDQLHIATGWERAAIVFAFTRDGTAGERTDLTRSDITTGYTPREFAARGYSGLRSDQTVRVYRNAWRYAIEHGHAEPVKPGQTVTLPTIDWPPTGHSDGDWRTKKDASAAEKAQLVEHLLTDPDVVKAAEDAIVDVASDSGRLAARVVSAYGTKNPKPKSKSDPVLVPAHLRALHGYAANVYVATERLNEPTETILAWMRDTSLDADERALVRDTIVRLRAIGGLLADIARTLEGELGEMVTQPSDDSWIDRIERNVTRGG